MEPFDTTNMHLAAMALGVLAGKFTTSFEPHLMAIGACLSTFANVFSYIVEKGEVIREKLKEIFYAN